MSAGPAPEGFRERFCHHHGCPVETFEKEVVRRCFPPFARPLGALLLGIRPTVFVRELALVGRLGRAPNESVVRGELDGYAYENARDKRFRVRSLGLRLSRRRFVRIYRQMMGEPTPGRAAAGDATASVGTPAAGTPEPGR